MDDIFVGRVMSSTVYTVSRDTTVQVSAKTMHDNGIGSLVVVDESGQLAGILTSTDFVRIAAEGGCPSETPVEEFMSTDVVTTTVNTTIRDVADTMVEHGFHHVPVVDDGEGVVGMVTTTDLTAYLSHVEQPSPS